MTQQIHSQRPVGLEARRLALGLSRERLAAKADGMSSATIRRAERGDTVPHPRTVAALANLYNRLKGRVIGADPDCGLLRLLEHRLDGLQVRVAAGGVYSLIAGRVGADAP